jgi:hypothetical protein
VTASGVFAPSAGASLALSGTWDSDAKTLHLTGLDGGGGTWTFDGGLNAFGMEGFFTGPSAESGVFSLFSGSAAVTVIVGTYGPPPPYAGLGCTPHGTFNFAISGTEVHGNAYDTCNSQTIPLDGTYAANGAIAIVRPSDPTGPKLATGTLSGTTASGQWSDGTYSGVWSGTKQ